MFCFIIGLFVSWSQKETELNDPPKFIVAPPKEKLPSLITPKKINHYCQKTFLIQKLILKIQKNQF